MNTDIQGNKIIVLNGFGRESDLKQLLKDMAFDKTQGTDFHENELATLQQFKYHSDWNLLMLVVDKIESKEIDLDVSVVTKNDKCRIYRHKNTYYEYAVTEIHEGGKKIDAVFNAVIQFIQWYQQNKTI